MNKKYILGIGLFLLICFGGGCSTEKQAFYGVYTFEEVSYLSPLSSSTADYINEQMAKTKFTIKADLFKIEFPDNTVEVSSPKYLKEEIKKGSPTVSDIGNLINNEVEQQYTIYSKDGSKTYWRLYISSDKMWIAKYVDNTADGSEIIMSIYKLSK